MKKQNSTEHGNALELLRFDKIVSNHITPNLGPNWLRIAAGLLSEVIRLHYNTTLKHVTDSEQKSSLKFEGWHKDNHTDSQCDLLICVFILTSVATF